MAAIISAVSVISGSASRGTRRTGNTDADRVEIEQVCDGVINLKVQLRIVPGKELCLPDFIEYIQKYEGEK